MIGRLEAPGAKLEPVMPGFENRGWPSWAVPWRRSPRGHHGDRCELIGHDWQHARLRRGSYRRGLRLRRAFAGLSGRCAGDAHWPREGTTGLRRTIGLGAVTVISGSCVEEGGALRPGPSRVGYRA